MTALAFDPDDPRAEPDAALLDPVTHLLSLSNDELRRLRAAIDALDASIAEEPRELG